MVEGPDRTGGRKPDIAGARARMEEAKRELEAASRRVVAQQEQQQRIQDSARRLVHLTFADETARLAMQKISVGMEEAKAIQAAAAEVEAHHIEHFHSVKLLHSLQARLLELGTPLPQNLLTPAMNLVRE